MKQTHYNEYSYNIFHLGMLQAYPREIIDIASKGVGGYFKMFKIEKIVKESYELLK